MIATGLLAAAQAVLHVPVTESGTKADPAAGHSIVVATTVRQSDPRPIQCSKQPCTSWFKAEFEKAVTIAGPSLPAKFVAEFEMGSPFNQPYEMVWIIEHGGDGTLRVNDTVGFYYATNEACFGPEIAALFPEFESVPRLVRRHKAICVKER